MLSASGRVIFSLRIVYWNTHLSTTHTHTHTDKIIKHDSVRVCPCARRAVASLGVKKWAICCRLLADGTYSTETVVRFFTIRNCRQINYQQTFVTSTQSIISTRKSLITTTKTYLKFVGLHCTTKYTHSC